MFITVRADEKRRPQRCRPDCQECASGTTRRTSRPKTAICRQDLALQSAAPIGDNEFGRTSIALGGAVGALLSSPHNATILEEGGVEFGIHKDNQSPVVIDPFARDNGYAMFTVGDTGSGKSFSSKQNFIRSIEQSKGPYRHHPRTAEQLGRRLRGARRQANHGRRDTRSEPSGDSGDARTRPASDG